MRIPKMGPNAGMDAIRHRRFATVRTDPRLDPRPEPIIRREVFRGNRRSSKPMRHDPRIRGPSPGRKKSLVSISIAQTSGGVDLRDASRATEKMIGDSIGDDVERESAGNQALDCLVAEMLFDPRFGGGPFSERLAQEPKRLLIPVKAIAIRLIHETPRGHG